MLIEFDQTTIANMTAALDQVCKKIPADKDGHETRKQIANAMVECAQSGPSAARSVPKTLSRQQHPADSFF
jgi:hypothetical protein